MQKIHFMCQFIRVRKCGFQMGKFFGIENAYFHKLNVLKTQMNSVKRVDGRMGRQRRRRVIMKMEAPVHKRMIHVLSLLNCLCLTGRYPQKNCIYK